MKAFDISKCLYGHLVTICVVVGAVVLEPAPAYGAACCSSATVLGAGRLKVWEESAGGVSVAGSIGVGRWDHHGVWKPYADDYRDDALRANVWSMLRLERRWELQLNIPWRYGLRAAGELSGSGGGIGDIVGFVRYEVFGIGEIQYIPALAIYLGARVPTGTRIEQTTQPLAADTTGIGNWASLLSVVIEKARLPYFVQLRLGAEASLPFTRPNTGLTQKEGMMFSAALSGGFEFIPDTLTMSISVGAQQRRRRRIDATAMPDSDVRVALVSTGLAWSMNPHWTLQASFGRSITSKTLGKNSPASFAGEIGLRYGYF